MGAHMSDNKLMQMMGVQDYPRAFAVRRVETGQWLRPIHGSSMWGWGFGDSPLMFPTREDALTRTKRFTFDTEIVAILPMVVSTEYVTGKVKPAPEPPRDIPDKVVGIVVTPARSVPFKVKWE